MIELLNNGVDSALFAFATLFGIDDLVPLQDLRIFFCLLSAFPFAYLFRFLPDNANLKHSLGGLLGFWYGYYTFGSVVFHTAFSALISYVIMVSVEAKGGRMHKAVFIWAMAYLSLGQIWRVYLHWHSLESQTDFSAPQMLLTIKLTTLSFDYYDGVRSLNNVDSLTPHQKKMSFLAFPTILEYFGYIYHFNGYMAGPIFNFKEYREYINMNMFKSNGGTIPHNYSLAWNRFGRSIFLVIFVVLSQLVPVKFMLTKEWDDMDFVHRYGYMWLSTGLTRTPYYFAWACSEAACIMSGIAYSGKNDDGEAQFDNAEAVHILNFELAQNFREASESWNIRTDQWLKHYIYERVDHYRVFLTFLTSSVWHGFFPGYYLSFMSCAPTIIIMRIIRRNIRTRFINKDGTPGTYKRYYDIICLLATTTVMNYYFTTFKLLDLGASLHVWSSLFFAGHILTISIFIVAIIIGPPRKIRDDIKSHNKSQ